MKTLQRVGQLAILGVLAAATAGCADDATTGYTLANQYRKGIKTVSVPIWTRGKDIYRRGLEMRLTEALVKRIELDTPYKVTTRARADTLLSGTIETIAQRVLSFDPDSGLPRELEMTITVSFRWTDLRKEGKIIIEQSEFRVAGIYIPHEPLSEDFFRGSEDTINRLAGRIVEQMEAPW